MKNLREKYGEWAVVTGASSGIGAEFGRQLAAAGMNVVLAARRKSNLVDNAKSIKADFGVETKVVEVDLGSTEGMKKLMTATNKLDVGIFVNNAATGGEMGSFLRNPEKHDTFMLKLNCEAPLVLGRRFGQKMRERGRGGIIFVSSTAAFQPAPYTTVYSASKAFISALGEALYYEWKKDNVDSLVLAPGATQTDMPGSMGIDLDKVPMKIMGVEPVVKAALRALGKKSFVIPGAMNKFMNLFSKRMLSRRFTSNMFGTMMKKTLPPERII